MAKGYEPKKLLVEGQEDLRVIPELIEKNGIRWGDNKREAIVSIQDCGGYENIDANLISTELQASGLTHLGVIYGLKTCTTYNILLFSKSDRPFHTNLDKITMVLVNPKSKK